MMATLQQPRSRVPLRRTVGKAAASPGEVADSAQPPVSRSGRFTRRQVPAAYRGQLIAAYGLLLAEFSLRLIQPLMIGLAINDLLGSSFRGLLLFAVGYLALTVTAAAGEMFRTRVFSAMHADVLLRSRTGDDRGSAEAQSPAQTMARLERTLPDRLHEFVAIAGPLLLLAWYDLTLVPFGLLLIVPVWLLQAACEPRISACLRQQQRSQADLEATDDVRQLPRQLETLRACRVSLTDTAAIRTALTELFVLGMLASAIVHYLGCGVVSPPAGDLFAVVCYLLLFAAGLRGTPVLKPREPPTSGLPC